MKIKIDWIEIPSGEFVYGLSAEQKHDLTGRLREAYGFDLLTREEQKLFDAICTKKRETWQAKELAYRQQLIQTESRLLWYRDALAIIRDTPDARTLTLETYYIARFPIRRDEAEIWYAEPVAQEIGWVLKRLGKYNGIDKDDPDRPERFLWDSADALAHWLGGRLPTVFEWEKAARGTDGRLYPWGNEWNPGAANVGAPESRQGDQAKRRGRVTAVDAYPEGASPYGVMDMVGNLGEWTASIDANTMHADSPIYMCYTIKDMPIEGEFFWALPIHRTYSSFGPERYTGCRPILREWGRHLWAIP